MDVALKTFTTVAPILPSVAAATGNQNALDWACNAAESAAWLEGRNPFTAKITQFSGKWLSNKLNSYIARNDRLGREAKVAIDALTRRAVNAAGQKVGNYYYGCQTEVKNLKRQREEVPEIPVKVRKLDAGTTPSIRSAGALL
jgi:hypothetical protein